MSTKVRLRLGHTLAGYAYGSRVKGTAKRFSDLDLILKSHTDRRKLRQIKNAFEESNLPYEVDIQPWDSLPKNFKSQIEKDLVPFE